MTTSLIRKVPSEDALSAIHHAGTTKNVLRSRTLSQDVNRFMHMGYVAMCRYVPVILSVLLTTFRYIFGMLGSGVYEYGGSGYVWFVL